MKITVERDRFAEAISSAMRAAGKANTIPILNNVLLKPNGAAVAIAGTNLTTWFETEVPAEIEGVSDEGVTILSEALSGIINRLPGGAQLSLEWDDPMRGANLRSGSARYRLNTLPATDFPELQHPQDAIRFSMSAKTLLEGLTSTKFAMTTDKARNYLRGVFMHVTNDEHQAFGGSRERRLVFCACSGFELARASAPMPPGAAEIPAVILPDISISEIVRLVTDADGDVEVSVSTNLVSFTVAGMTFSTKLVEGTFPDYAYVFNPPSDKQMIADVDLLSQALQRLVTIDEANRTCCEMDNGELKLTLVNHKVGDADERVEIEWQGEPYKIPIRARGLLSILDAVDSDQCLIKFTHSRGIIIVNPWRAGAPDYTRTFGTMPIES